MELHLNKEKTTVASDNIQNALTILKNGVLEGYKLLDENKRFAIKTGVRTLLIPWLESQFGQDIRPPKNTDPIHHLLEYFIIYAVKGIQGATIQLGTSKPTQQRVSKSSDQDETNRLTSLTIWFQGEGESGRQLVFTWPQREREDLL